MPTTDDLIKKCRERTPDSFVSFYNWMLSGLGYTLPAHMIPVVLALCDTRIDKLMLIVGPGATKSQALSVIYPAWLLGGDPTQTIIGVSGAEDLAQGFMNAVMELIEHKPEWNLIYPKVRPDLKAGWSTRGAYVTGHKIGVSDANFWAGGLTSRVLVGKHAQTLILDDLHTAENSATVEQCEGVFNKYANTLLGRADPNGCRFILAGRRWHEEDLYGRLMKSESWVCLRLPAERTDKERNLLPQSKRNWLWHDVYVPDDMDCVFTDGKVHCADGQIVSVKNMTI